MLARVQLVAITRTTNTPTLKNFIEYMSVCSKHRLNVTSNSIFLLKGWGGALRSTPKRHFIDIYYEAIPCTLQILWIQEHFASFRESKQEVLLQILQHLSRRYCTLHEPRFGKGWRERRLSQYEPRKYAYRFSTIRNGRWEGKMQA